MYRRVGLHSLGGADGKRLAHASRIMPFAWMASASTKTMPTPCHVELRRGSRWPDRAAPKKVSANFARVFRSLKTRSAAGSRQGWTPPLPPGRAPVAYGTIRSVCKGAPPVHLRCVVTFIPEIVPGLREATIWRDRSYLNRRLLQRSLPDTFGRAPAPRTVLPEPLSTVAGCRTDWQQSSVWITFLDLGRLGRIAPQGNRLPPRFLSSLTLCFI